MLLIYLPLAFYNMLFGTIILSRAWNLIFLLEFLIDKIWDKRPKQNMWLSRILFVNHKVMASTAQNADYPLLRGVLIRNYDDKITYKVLFQIIQFKV
jgi:hypothetical protein